MPHLNPVRKWSRWTALPLLAALLCTLHLSAQPVLVKDINTRTEKGGNSNPSQPCNVNGTLFFVSNDGVNGPELWKTNGTAAGTVLVKNIYPGKGGFTPQSLTNVNGTLFFVADNGAAGRELWKSDGTAAGTVMVKDISPGPNSSYPFEFTNVNGTLFFSAENGMNGRELWKSDGTEAGTVMVRNIQPENGFYGSNPSRLTNVNGTLYFSAYTSLYGQELWKSDGTAAGTLLVKDINPGEGFSGAEQLTSVNGILYFTISDGNNGAVLWRSNGTDAGTLPLKAFPAPYGVYGLTNVNGTLFLIANHGTNGAELWKSNGTAAGTTLVKNIYPGPNGFRAQPLTSMGNTLYFRANDGVSGDELWKSDGTATGTVMVKDIAAGPDFAYPYQAVVMGGALYFVAEDRVNGGELWKTDGTAAGTGLVKDIFVGWNSSLIQFLTVANNTLYMSAFDGLEQELWKSNGTEAGTVRVKDIRPGSNGAAPGNLTNVNGTAYFTANDGISGNELWKSNGTAAGTLPVKDIAPGAASADPSWLTNVNGTLYFTANDGTTGAELWKSDGITTTRVKDILPGPAGSSPAWLTNVNGTLYFAADDGVSGQELWKSDGTAAGTVRVKDINPETGYASPAMLTNVNGTLYFLANDGVGGHELWRSNGTAGGTTLVKDIAPGATSAFPTMPYYTSGSDPRLGFVHQNGILYLQATDGIHGVELWRSDGTAAGTRLVKDIYPGAGSAFLPYFDARRMIGINGTVYFAADDGVSGQELWKSDGTAASTARVIDGMPGPEPSHPSFLTNFKGTLYFTAHARVEGMSRHNLWKSDGTAGGTVALADPSRLDYAFNLMAVGNGLCFTAILYSNSGFFGGIGLELWYSDGTAAGTLLAKDIEAGPESSWPGNLTDVNGTLYFSASQGSKGAELWKYTPGACVTPNTALTVTGSTTCGSNPARVSVKGTQPGVTYQLYFTDSPLGEPVAGGGDITLSVPRNVLVPAVYALTVRASGCVEVPLAQQASIEVLAPIAAPVVAAVAVNPGDAALLTATGAPAGSTYRWYGAASGGNVLATGATFTTPRLWARTTYYASVYAGTTGCESARVAATVNVNGGSQFRLNAGGGAFTMPEGSVFAADTYFSGGTVSAIAGGEVANTTGDDLYRNMRIGAAFSYNLPTGSGTFDVTLHFNETYWGYRTIGGAGSRQFNVDLEGSRKLTNYDIFAKAGGAMRARTETFRVTVADGTLNIAFSKGLADNAAVSAIEAVPVSNGLRVNAGGGTYTTGSGKTFQADTYYAGGALSSLVTADVAGTTDDPLYQTGRHGAFSYNVPVTGGTYDVVLHFNETYWGYQAAGGVGSRQFNVDIEGSRKLTNYDIFAKAGGAMRAVSETFRVTVADATLNIAFTKGLADLPRVAALEVVPVAASRVAAAGTGSGEPNGVTLYPNPARDRLYVALDGPAEGVTGTALTDALGVVRLVNGHRVKDAHTLEVDVRSLRPGAYLLTLTTAGESRLLRFIKQ